MLPLVVLVLCLFAGLILLARWFVTADPKAVVRALKIFGLMVAVVAVLFLAVAGRLGVALAAGAALLPIVLRWRALARRAKAARGPSGGQVSTLHTDYLDVELDHDTGAMAGTVRAGRFAGRNLGDMTIDELKALHAECAGADPQSAPIVAAFLDRTFGSDWRSAGGPEAQPPPGGPMSREEALSILGLSPDATEEEIREAHRRLMKRLHPDQGGSDYLAAKLNAAKDVLLG